MKAHAKAVVRLHASVEVASLEHASSLIWLLMDCMADV